LFTESCGFSSCGGTSHSSTASVFEGSKHSSTVSIAAAAADVAATPPPPPSSSEDRLCTSAGQISLMDELSLSGQISLVDKPSLME
jgi:hypothetical protein